MYTYIYICVCASLAGTPGRQVVGGACSKLIHDNPNFTPKDNPNLNPKVMPKSKSGIVKLTPKLITLPQS